MNPTLLVGIISAVTALIVAVAGYRLNRRRDRDTEWRELKLEHYKEYLAALSGITGQRSTPEAQARYADAFNSLVLVAPPSVLATLYAFHQEQRIDNRDRTPSGYDQRHNDLIHALRRDIHPELRGENLKFYLIDAGPGPTVLPTASRLAISAIHTEEPV